MESSDLVPDLDSGRLYIFMKLSNLDPTFFYFSVLTYSKLITNIFQPEPCDNILILSILTSSTSLHLHLAIQYWSMYCSLLDIGSQEVSV